jgi:hypothetical protein
MADMNIPQKNHSSANARIVGEQGGAGKQAITVLRYQTMMIRTRSPAPAIVEQFLALGRARLFGRLVWVRWSDFLDQAVRDEAVQFQALAGSARCRPSPRWLWGRYPGSLSPTAAIRRSPTTLIGEIQSNRYIPER